MTAYDSIYRAGRLTTDLRLELLSALLRAYANDSMMSARFDDLLLGEVCGRDITDGQLAAMSLPLLEKVYARFDAHAKQHPNPETVVFLRENADRVLRFLTPKREAQAHTDGLAKTLGLVCALCLALIFGGRASASEHWQVDQPQSWYRADVSHHGKHAAGGVVIGAASYAVVRGLGGTRGEAVGAAVVDGALIGIGYELVEGRDGRSWVDPVDALWVTAGAAVGGATAALTEKAIGVALAVEPRRDGVVIAWSKKL